MPVSDQQYGTCGATTQQTLVYGQYAGDQARHGGLSGSVLGTRCSNDAFIFGAVVSETLHAWWQAHTRIIVSYPDIINLVVLTL